MKSSSRKDYVNRTWRLPYQFFFEALSSIFKQGQLSQNETGLAPDRLVLHITEDDRKFRRQSESYFIEELTYDLVIMVRQAQGGGGADMAVELRTAQDLIPGRIRTECYHGETLLATAIREWRGEEAAASLSREWVGTEMLPEDQSKGPTILVVDDEPVLCAVLQRMLSKLKYRVVTANNGLEALRVLSYMQADLVITDLRMPKMGGWELMQRIKKSTPDLPVVLITGYHSIYSRDMAEASPASGYISKPFSFLEIKTLLDRVLGEPGTAERA